MPLSVPGGLFTPPLGSSMPSTIGFPPHLYGGSPRASGHVELFHRSSPHLPSGGSLPLNLPRSGTLKSAAYNKFIARSTDQAEFWPATGCPVLAGKMLGGEPVASCAWIWDVSQAEGVVCS